MIKTEFADKLNFLFELIRAEGKELVAKLSITPPGISKMREGLWGLHHNREAEYSIALFVQRCQRNEQRGSLAKAMRVAQVVSVEEETLADMLLSCFLNEKVHDTLVEKVATAFLQHLSFSAGSRTSGQTNASQPLHSTGNNTITYYGDEGKRIAFITFWRYLLNRKEAFDICVLSDENNADPNAHFANGGENFVGEKL